MSAFRSQVERWPGSLSNQIGPHRYLPPASGQAMLASAGNTSELLGSKPRHCGYAIVPGFFCFPGCGAKECGDEDGIHRSHRATERTKTVRCKWTHGLHNSARGIRGNGQQSETRA